MLKSITKNIAKEISLSNSENLLIFLPNLQVKEIRFELESKKRRKSDEIFLPENEEINSPRLLN